MLLLVDYAYSLVGCLCCYLSLTFLGLYFWVVVLLDIVVSWGCRLDGLGVCGEFGHIDCVGVGFGWYYCLVVLLSL